METTTTQPTIRLLSTMDGPGPRRRTYLVTGGTLAPEWAAQVRPGHVAWSEGWAVDVAHAPLDGGTTHDSGGTWRDHRVVVSRATVRELGED